MKSPRNASSGVMLIELMVGLAVATIAIGAAIAALLVARDAASAVNEMTLLQQDASYALRLLGLQIRAAGSNELQASPANAGSFRFASGAPDEEDRYAVRGTEGAAGASDSIHLTHTSPPLLASQQYDCLGQEARPGSRIEATLQVDSKGQLQCKGPIGKPQPLIAGVAALKLRYRVRQGDLVRSLSAADVEAAQLWPEVSALEVCLELQGEAHAAAFEGSYIDCLNRSVRTDGRLRLVVRKLFSLNVVPKT